VVCRMGSEASIHSIVGVIDAQMTKVLVVPIPPAVAEVAEGRGYRLR
jgi:hypothetical protein